MGDIWDPIGRAFKAAIVFVAHFLILAVLLLLIWAFEQGFRFLYPNEEPVFFGVLPVKWLIQAIDLVLILMLGIQGTIEAYRTFRAKGPDK